MSEGHGRCDCGAVAFNARDLRPGVTLCHCSQCRRFSGHAWAATRAAVTDISFIRDGGLRWHASSAGARRGFCGICGSSLFYQPNGADHIAIAAGCLELPTGLRMGKHIHIADAGDYYAVPHDAPHDPDQEFEHV